jgi:transposase
MDLLTELTLAQHDPAVIEQVRALIEHAEKAKQLLAQNDVLLARSDAKLAEKDFKIAALTLELAYYRRIRFGNKSEAFSGEQRELFEETVDADLAAILAELGPQDDAQDGATPKRKRSGAGRQALPVELPRIEHRHEPASCQCDACRKGMVLIGEDISEQLDVEPARFFVHRHIRPQYACRACERVVAAPVPPAIIDGGMAAPGLLAWVAVSKYTDHLPLYRIEQIGARQGVPLARSTLAEWTGKVGVALQPLSERLAELLKQRPCLHADETPVRQLDPGQGKTRHAYLWAYRSNNFDEGPPIVVFDYQIGRAGAHARAFLLGWQGQLMVDDYSGYKAMFASGITELACLAHVRRKFFDLHAANGSPIAAEALRRIGLLYAVEQHGSGLAAPARLQLREEQAKPALAELHSWLLGAGKTVATGSGTAKAIDYTLRRWPALLRYADSGTLPIDNNPVENAIRPIAVGKKNWLFAGSERAGRRAAAIQTLLATAKLNGLEPLRWLTETLEKLPTCPNSQIDSLLPFAKSTQP